MMKQNTTHLKGFTLIELLVVVAIVGILASVAIPQYKDYKKRAYDALALSDLRSVALAEEAYYLDSETYYSCQNDSCLTLPGIHAISRGVEIQVDATDEEFTGRSTHTKGSGREYIWESARGGLQ